MSQTAINPEILKQVAVAKALGDDAFRAQLVANPAAAFEATFGQALPAEIKLRVVEEASGEHVIVLPHAATVAADGELSDNDLEAVSGGSKAAANKLFNQMGSALLAAPAMPVLMPAHDLGGKAGKDWANGVVKDMSAPCR